MVSDFERLWNLPREKLMSTSVRHHGDCSVMRADHANVTTYNVIYLTLGRSDGNQRECKIQNYYGLSLDFCFTETDLFWSASQSGMPCTRPRTPL